MAPPTPPIFNGEFRYDSALSILSNTHLSQIKKGSEESRSGFRGLILIIIDDGQDDRDDDDG